MADIFFQRAPLEALNASGARSLVAHLGIQIIEQGEDFLRGTMPVDQRTHQPFGLLHGGASVALAETLGSLAGNLCLDPAVSMAVGLEISANHIRSVTEGVVTGTARPLHVGRNTQVWDAVVTDEAGGKKIALFRCTQMILWPKA